jgi:intein-encoded DNA endonuclease-like protein
LEKRRLYKGYNPRLVSLGAKDKEFVEKFASCIAMVLNIPPPKLKYKQSKGQYYIEVASTTFYELLRKPVDLKRLKKYIEHCDMCKKMFLQGFIDSEGCIDEKGRIYISNTNYELLIYVQKLLREFGIESTGPRPTSSRRGTVIHNPRTGKQYLRNKDEYVIYIRASSNEDFYRHIGFTIKR